MQLKGFSWQRVVCLAATGYVFGLYCSSFRGPSNSDPQIKAIRERPALCNTAVKLSNLRYLYDLLTRLSSRPQWAAKNHQSILLLWIWSVPPSITRVAAAKAVKKKADKDAQLTAYWVIQCFTGRLGFWGRHDHGNWPSDSLSSNRIGQRI